MEAAPCDGLVRYETHVAEIESPVLGLLFRGISLFGRAPSWRGEKTMRFANSQDLSPGGWLAEGPS